MVALEKFSSTQKKKKKEIKDEAKARAQELDNRENS